MSDEDPLINRASFRFLFHKRYECVPARFTSRLVLHARGDINRAASEVRIDKSSGPEATARYSKMLFLILTACLLAVTHAGCPMRPTVEQTSSGRTPGDGGYRILISGQTNGYVPNAVHTISLQGSQTHERLQQFTRFTLTVHSQHAPNNPSARIGYFQLFPDSLTTFNEDCINTVSETTDYPKSEIQVMWRAPQAGSGCVIFTAMILENNVRWYAEDGGLSKTVCESTGTETSNETRCCACDEAKYSLTMEGIWSNRTHPKDFPFSAWLTHFSDVIGASHEPGFSFWGRDHIATDGFRQLAEWGSATGVEAELREKSRQLRTLIKAAGLWYPNVNTNTTTSFSVDRKHPLLSVASMLGPSPDWVVGVSKLNLCQKDCTWAKSMIIDLYPWDAGTDNGISYMSPNSETKPREKMRPITTLYPEDPRSPFYDPSGKPMHPLARLYLNREKIIQRGCSEEVLQQQVAELEVAENTEDTSRPECQTTDYSPWSSCSVTCGKGLRMRTRSYRMPEKAAMFNCNRQLVSKEMCVASIPECSGEEENDDDAILSRLESELPIYSISVFLKTISLWRSRLNCQFLELAIFLISSVVCMEDADPGPCRGYFQRWAFNPRKLMCTPFAYGGCRGNRNNFLTSDECSNTCGVVRAVLTGQAFNETINQDETLTDSLNPPHLPVDCVVTRWSNWSPCSVTCGVGRVTSYRTIQREAAYGGRPCPKKLHRRYRCELAPCE
ncbi:spondin-1-like [Pogonomyrmex barbatus]|uniref:Spondin-1 n=1 Tax=Pogonomyrmex barbatus TaxID=144034 RepID=A0A6I9VWF6_9HYME|nr:spondin-1-like [Pogonomyrmex barbatus]